MSPSLHSEDAGFLEPDLQLYRHARLFSPCLHLCMLPLSGICSPSLVFIPAMQKPIHPPDPPFPRISSTKCLFRSDGLFPSISLPQLCPSPCGVTDCQDLVHISLISSSKTALSNTRAISYVLHPHFK